MHKNIFVLGLERFNLDRLKNIRNASQYRFHSLLDFEEIVKPRQYRYRQLLQKAEAQLESFSGHIDGIVSHWDFPAQTMLPLLCRRFGLPGPTLESVLKCGHKYWARVEQKKIIPEHIPDFCAVDPFAGNPLAQVSLDTPFWLKPIKSFGSHLGFRIDAEADFARAIEITRKRIRRIGDAYNEALEYADLPAEIEGIGGNHCIAEQIITGERQNGPEGYVYQGDVQVYGITDSLKDPGTNSFNRYSYPSVWPEHLQARSREISKRLVRHVGLDNTPFNTEFIWDEDSDRICLIELNPRISQSLSYMFEKVHGASNHQVAVALAQGRKPDYPMEEGRFRCAAKFMWRHYQDAIVKRVPDREQIEKVKQLFPGTEVSIEVREGMRLSDLMDQDSYSYEIAIMSIGAQNHEALLERYRRCREILQFEFADIHQPRQKDAG